MIRAAIDAKWKKLLLVNYPVDQKILEPYLPFHTEFALWNNTCYVSLVGFLFLDVKISGIPIPMHTNFVEINLRFYVRRKFKDEWRYGVVFLKEIVALPVVTLVANTLFSEHYETMPVGYTRERNSEEIFIEYRWKKNEWNSIQINSSAALKPIEDQTQENFFTAQHWGYTKIKEDKTKEYSVTHPKWQLYDTKSYNIQVNFAKVFGSQYAFLTDQAPESVFLAEGSDILLKQETTIKRQQSIATV